jgi:hypothetical protein
MNKARRRAMFNCKLPYFPVRSIQLLCQHIQDTRNPGTILLLLSGMRRHFQKYLLSVPPKSEGLEF